MKTQKKAVLLSALVLPGLGQITLKRYKIGIAIIVTTIISIYRMMSIAMEQANVIVNKLMAQGGVLDMQAIVNASGQSVGAVGNASYNLYVWIIIICWLISIADAWLAGKKI